MEVGTAEGSPLAVSSPTWLIFTFNFFFFFLLLLLLIFNLILFFKLYIIVLVLPNIKMIFDFAPSTLATD